MKKKNIRTVRQTSIFLVTRQISTKYEFSSLIRKSKDPKSQDQSLTQFSTMAREYLHML